MLWDIKTHIATCTQYYWLYISNYFGPNSNMNMCAICDYGACPAMTELSFMSFAGLKERLSWLAWCGHGGVSMGIYYSRHNYAVGRFVSQSIRTQLFIRLPVIALRWRHASHTDTTISQPHTYMPANTNRHTHAPLSGNISSRKQGEASRQKWRDDNCSLLSFSYFFRPKGPCWDSI